MRENATLMLRGDKLQPELAAALEGGEADALYAIHVEKLSVEDTAFYLETRTKVQEGLAEIEAGEVVDADEVWAGLEAKLGITIAR
jgi:hypothetical protein